MVKPAKKPWPSRILCLLAVSTLGFVSAHSEQLDENLREYPNWACVAERRAQDRTVCWDNIEMSSGPPDVESPVCCEGESVPCGGCWLSCKLDLGQNRDCFLQIPIRDCLIKINVYSDIHQHLDPASDWALVPGIGIVLIWSSRSSNFPNLIAFTC